MSDENFYRILGVETAASADEIRSAYRELVKKHHPDLFTHAADKAAATEKLRQINEAYAVLGNAKRRSGYDRELEQMRRPSPAARADARRSSSRSPGRARPRAMTRTVPKARAPVRIPRKWAGYSLAIAAASLLLFLITRSEPSLVSAWLLMEKLEVSPASKNAAAAESSRDGWKRVGDYGSVSECVTILKQKVAQDEREGSKAVYGDPNATMAITMLVKGESPRREGANVEAGISFDAKSMTKRVRILQCGQTQRIKMESWLQRTLRRAGLNWIS